MTYWVSVEIHSFCCSYMGRDVSYSVLIADTTLTGILKISKYIRRSSLYVYTPQFIPHARSTSHKHSICSTTHTLYVNQKSANTFNKSSKLWSLSLSAATVHLIEATCELMLPPCSATQTIAWLPWRSRDCQSFTGGRCCRPDTRPRDCTRIPSPRRTAHDTSYLDIGRRALPRRPHNLFHMRRTSFTPRANNTVHFPAAVTHSAFGDCRRFARCASASAMTFNFNDRKSESTFPNTYQQLHVNKLSHTDTHTRKLFVAHCSRHRRCCRSTNPIPSPPPPPVNPCTLHTVFPNPSSKARASN